MKKKAGNSRCFLSTGNDMGCCKVESVISIDDRGQMVLPKETREKAGIEPGDKLTLVSWEKKGKICCMFLIKADELAGMVKNMLSPIMKEIMK
jgi:antitoxin PrlF